MGDPKWCIAMGACASTGGMHRCYGVVQGVDNFLPVDVYISGCPPRPESVLHALMDIQEKIRNEYSVVQDYTHGEAASRAPVLPENTNKFPGQLEKPKVPDATLETVSATARDDAEDDSAEPALA
jgi:NADH-quinone oxidoreductase subunit B